MVRTIVILGVLAICAFLAGWFTIDRTDTETTIRFDRDEIRADASKAIEKGRELFNSDGSEQSIEDSNGQQPTTDGFFAPYSAQPSEAFGADYNSSPQQATRTVPPWDRAVPATGAQQY